MIVVKIALLKIFRTFLIFSLSFLSFSGLAFSAEYTVFGPQGYTRSSGSPITITNTFTVADTSGPFILKLYNGGLEDDEAELVSSTEVFLNGVKIVSPNELNQKTAYLEKEVTLQSLNTLEVEVRGKPGGVFTLIITGIDIIAPVVKIISPLDNSLVNTPVITVAYTVDGIAKTKQINLAEGQNTVTIEESDLAGNIGSDSITVILDTIAPIVEITSPSDGTLTNNSNLIVEYTVDSTLKNKQVILTEGENAVIVEEVDLAGNVGSDSISVILDSIAPAVPQGLTQVSGDAKVDLFWDFNIEEDLAGYNVYRSEVFGSSYIKVNTALVTQPSYTDNTVTNGIAYYYVTTAVDNTDNESVYSAEVTAAPKSSEPFPAEWINFSAAPGKSVINLSVRIFAEEGLPDWIKGCNIYRSQTQGGPYELIHSITFNSEAWEYYYADTQVTNDIIYYYVLTAVDSIGSESGYSNELSAIPSDKDPFPQGAFYFSAEPSKTSVNLRVSLPESGSPELKGCNIYRSDASGGPYEQIHSITFNPETLVYQYADTEVTSGATYYYVFTAVDLSGSESDFSSEVSATPGVSDPFPDNWINFSTTIGKNTVSLSINLFAEEGFPDWIKGCNIYRSQTQGGPYELMHSITFNPEVWEYNYNDTEVTNDVTYYYVLTAVDSSGSGSGYSQEISATPRQATYVGGQISGHTTWTVANSPYIVNESIILASSNASLTIEPGVEVRFDANTGFYVTFFSAILADGTEEDPIIFTSNAENPQPGDWERIYFDRWSSGIMNHCVIEYGGSYGNMLGVYRSTLNLRNSIIRNSSSDAIHSGAGTINLENNLILDNGGIGINVYGDEYTTVSIVGSQIKNNGSDGVICNSGNITIKDNEILNNAGAGIRFEGDAHTYLDAFYNEIRNNTYGIYGHTNHGAIVNNTISDSSSYNGYALQGTVNLACNWWSTLEPVNGIYGNVVYEPFLTSNLNRNFYFQNAFVSRKRIALGVDSGTFAASLSQIGNWSITIMDSLQNEVKHFSGQGLYISQVWNGGGDSGELLPEGIYTYLIEASSVLSGEAAASLMGRLELLENLPMTARITSPEFKENIWNQNIEVTGTASGIDFASYKLEYGKGNSPTVWTAIVSASTPIENGILGNWTPPQEAGSYVLKLTVTDTSNTETTDAVLVSYEFLDVSVSPLTLDPAKGEIVTISYILAEDAYVTVNIYDERAKSLVRTLVGYELQSAGEYNIEWNGKDDSGQTLSMDAYYFALTAEDGNGKVAKHNDAANPAYGALPLTLSWSIEPDNFDPYKNEITEIKYEISQNGRIVVETIFPDTAQIIRTLSNNEPRLAGINAELWDGRDDSGNIHSGRYDGYLGAPEALPRDLIILQNNTVKIANLHAEAYLIVPSNDQISTIYYTITHNADITIIIEDSNGNYFCTLLDDHPQSFGEHTIEWDGTNDDGKLAYLEGDYRVKITAVDSLSGVSFGRTGTILVYKR